MSSKAATGKRQGGKSQQKEDPSKGPDKELRKEPSSGDEEGASPPKSPVGRTKIDHVLLKAFALLNLDVKNPNNPVATACQFALEDLAIFSWKEAWKGLAIATNDEWKVSNRFDDGWHDAAYAPFMAVCVYLSEQRLGNNNQPADTITKDLMIASFMEFSAKGGKSESEPKKGEDKPTTAPRRKFESLPLFSGKAEEWFHWKNRATTHLVMQGFNKLIGASDEAEKFADENPDMNEYLWCLLDKALFHKDAETSYLTSYNINPKEGEDPSLHSDGRKTWVYLINYFESAKLLYLNFKRAKKQFAALKLTGTQRACDYLSRFFTLMHFMQEIEKLVEPHKKKTEYASLDFSAATTSWKVELLSKIEKDSLRYTVDQLKENDDITLGEAAYRIREKDIESENYFNHPPKVPKKPGTNKDGTVKPGNTNEVKTTHKTTASTDAAAQMSRYNNSIYDYLKKKSPEEQKEWGDKLKQFRQEAKTAPEGSGSKKRARYSAKKCRKIALAKEGPPTKKQALANEKKLWDDHRG
jgi:hypothetical protein